MQTCSGEWRDRKKTCSDPVWIALSICLIGWNELWGPPADCHSELFYIEIVANITQQWKRHIEDEHNYQLQSMLNSWMEINSIQDETKEGLVLSGILDILHLLYKGSFQFLW